MTDLAETRRHAAIDAREPDLKATILDRACTTADPELERIALA